VEVPATEERGREDHILQHEWHSIDLRAHRERSDGRRLFFGGSSFLRDYQSKAVVTFATLTSSLSFLLLPLPPHSTHIFYLPSHHPPPSSYPPITPHYPLHFFTSADPPLTHLPFPSLLLRHPPPFFCPPLSLPLLLPPLLTPPLVYTTTYPPPHLPRVPTPPSSYFTPPPFSLHTLIFTPP
jgi:hypothetical protein